MLTNIFGKNFTIKTGDWIVLVRSGQFLVIKALFVENCIRVHWLVLELYTGKWKIRGNLKLNWIGNRRFFCLITPIFALRQYLHWANMAIKVNWLLENMCTKFQKIYINLYSNYRLYGWTNGRTGRRTDEETEIRKFITQYICTSISLRWYNQPLGEQNYYTL